MLFLALQSIADGLIVGRMIGATALAAVNIAQPIYTLVTAAAMIIGVGTQAQIGIRMGQGDYVGAKTALCSGVAGVALLTVAGTLIINLLADRIALFLGADRELIGPTVKYIHGVMPWLVGIGGFIMCDYLLKALGHPRCAMFIMAGTIILNIVASVMLVRWGLGTFGVGIGTGISFTTGGLLSVGIIRRQLRTTGPMRTARGRLSLSTLRRIAYNGSSEGMAEVASGITMFLFNITLMHYAGKAGVAAFTLINYLLFIGVGILVGISNGVIPIISYNYGAKLRHRMSGIVRLVLKTNIVCGVSFWLVLWLGGRAIVGLFIDPSEVHIVDLAARGARIVAFAFLFNGFNIFAASYFTAVDKPAHSLLIAGLRGLVFLVIGVLALPVWFHIDGIWLATVMAEIPTALIAWILLKGHSTKNSIGSIQTLKT